MSNALLVGGEHTKTGKPIAVFGPQTGYYMPQLLVEKDVHGPGIDARGVAFAGTDLYVAARPRPELRVVGDVGGRRQRRPVGAQALRARRRHADGRARWATCTTAPASRSRPTSTCRSRSRAPAAFRAIGESGGQCANAADDDGDGFVNDGCPAVGLPELPHAVPERHRRRRRRRGQRRLPAGRGPGHRAVVAGRADRRTTGRSSRAARSPTARRSRSRPCARPIATSSTRRAASAASTTRAS